MKILQAVAMQRCIGCHSCSLACSRLVHNTLSWNTAGIRIKSSGGLSTGYTAFLCQACTHPSCVDVCPSGAMSPRKDGGVIFHEKSCMRCGKCFKACPVGAIYTNEEGYPVVCIHCGRCVPFCPQNCIELREKV